MNTDTKMGLILLGIIMLLLLGMIFYVLFKMIISIFSTEKYLCKNCCLETRRNDDYHRPSASEWMSSYILPGASLYYGIRSITTIQKTCEHCGGHDLIPMNSPEAEAIMRERDSLSHNY